MEEETLLRERLQAITDKRRIREEIEKKRRNTEEEKLKLQYLKKKTLREQWLMDGLSTLSEEEQESVKAQAEDFQQKTKLLQSNIDRIELEIAALETQELEISAKEEILLKQLKEVEKTPEDIIKEVNANILPEPVQYIYTAIPDVPKCYTPTTRRRSVTPGKHETDEEQEKKATYTMKISVEKDLRTGKSHILSTTSIAPLDLQQQGIKVFEDGRKSVFALPPDGQVLQNDMNEMSLLEVEELLMKASEKKAPSDVEYHEPVFSSPFSQSTTPQRTERGYISLHGLQMPNKNQSPFQAEKFTKQEALYIPTTKTNQPAQNGPCANNEYSDITRFSPASSPTQQFEEQLRITPTADSGLGLGRYSPLNPNGDSSLNFMSFLPPKVESGEPVTMIFMGYQNAESDEEDEGIQAELVVIGDDEEDPEEAPLSYHPLGYHSKIFKPNSMVYRSEIRPGAIRTSSSGRHAFGNETEDQTGTGCSAIGCFWYIQSKSQSLWLQRSRASAKTESLSTYSISTSSYRNKGATTELDVVDKLEEIAGCSHPENPEHTELKSLSEPVTMETSENSSTANIIDCEMEVLETELPECKDTGNIDEQVCYDADVLESISTKVVVDILAGLPPTETKADELEDVCSPKEALVLEDTQEELYRNESITSSISDTPSSAESVYENDTTHKRQDSLRQEPLENITPQPDDVDDTNMLDPLVIDSHEDILEGFGCEEPEETILEHYIREEVLSDVSTESCHDPEEIDECLRVEIAAASSDSETDEKWRCIFSSSINKEDDDSYLDSLELSAQELFIQKTEVLNSEEVTKETEEQEVPVGEEVIEQPDNEPEEQPQELSYNSSTLFHGLSKISEDDEELGRGSATHKSNSFDSVKSDSSKKVPKDYCVIQEMKSENVSTEHVDFKVARQQWLEIEEQTKNFTHLPSTPTTRSGTCQGSHSFMYTPVRNIDRPKRDLESLSLAEDYAHTQFSPCSEDSGLDDSSYRSPFDDPETPIEKEIRQTMEREENLRRERGISKSYSSDCVQMRVRSASFNPGKLCQEVDDKRKTFEHQDDDSSISQSLRSKTPSFIITSSPTKSSQDLATNSVIILEPEPFPPSPRHGKMVSSKSADWRPEDTPNLIILETSNLIIRSASEFNLNSASEETQEKMFLNNPFFKLRSRSSISLVDEEIKMVKQREDELKRQRASIYSKDHFLMSPNRLDNSLFTDDVPIKCKSSPSSPMKTCRMDRSALSCDHRFLETYAGGRRKSAMALRWEAGEFANNE